MLTQIYTGILQAMAANVNNCEELCGDTTRKDDEKATHKYMLKSPVVVLASFLIAFAKHILNNEIGSHSKTSGFYPTCST